MPADDKMVRKAIKEEDTAHASGDLGMVILAVRKDTATALAGNDADYIPLIVDASGRLHVKLATEDLTALENITVDAVTTFPTKAPAAVTGTCTAAYATALNWTGLQTVPNKTIIVANTDATLTMKYRIRGYAKSGSSYYNEIQAENTLAASTMQPHVIQNHYEVITVEVIDGSGHATYAIDYAGGQ